jgi:hypothetical protein
MKTSRKSNAKAVPRPRKGVAREHLTSTSLVTVLEAMREKELFSRWFKDPKTWVFWTVFLASLFGLPLDAKGLEIFAQCTGRKAPLPGGYNEAWLCVGRRGGKSIVVALCAVFLGVFRDWSDRLVPGERGTVLVIAQDRKAARVIYRYITAMITEVPLIASLIDGEPTQDRIDLVNGVSIEISTANFKTVRGYGCGPTVARPGNSMMLVTAPVPRSPEPDCRGRRGARFICQRTLRPSGSVHTPGRLTRGINPVAPKPSAAWSSWG